MVDKPLEQGEKQNFDIQQDGPVFDVIHVVFNALFDGGVPPQTVHLGPAGDARADLVLDHVQGYLLLELVHKVGQLRPGAHQAHVPLEHVEKLGQLVDGEFADEGAEPGLPGVGVGAPSGVRGGVHPHGPELVHIKGLFVQTHPLLPEDDGAGGAELHPRGGKQHHRGGQDDEHQRARNIHGPLYKGVAQVVQGDAPQVDQGQAVQTVELGVGRHVLGVEGNEGQLGPRVLAGPDDQGHPLIILCPQSGDDLIGLCPGQIAVQLVKGAQVRQGGPIFPVGHIAQQGIAIFRALADTAHAVPGDVAAAHDDDVLLVVAAGPEAVQYRPQDHPLAAYADIYRKEKQGHGHTGKIGAPQQIEEHLQNNKVQAVAEKQPAQLGPQPDFPVGGIQIGKAIGQQVQGDQGAGRRQIKTEGHRLRPPGHHIKAHPIAEQKGQQHQPPVADDVQLIQQPLVFLDHRQPPFKALFLLSEKGRRSASFVV